MANGFDTDEESYVGDDPSYEGDTGVGYGSTTMDTGGNQTDGSILSQAGFNQAMNITAKNPFGDAGFFTSVFGIPADMLDYRGLGIDTQGIANLAYDRYVNPFVGVRGNQVVPGSGVEKEEDLKLREGLKPGELTRFGQVISIDRPQTALETAVRSAFGIATPLGPFASFMGREQLALAPDPLLNANRGFNYDSKLDPNSPDYQGPQGMLGSFGRSLEEITFGGARPITEGTKGIISLFEGQEAQKEMKDAVDQTGNNVSLMDSGANLGSAFNIDTNIDTNKIGTKFNTRSAQERANEIRKEAIEAYKNPNTRLSNNLTMHIERYKIRNR